jgi:hypothetical protein
VVQAHPEEVSFWPVVERPFCVTMVGDELGLRTTGLSFVNQAMSVPYSLAINEIVAE